MARQRLALPAGLFRRLEQQAVHAYGICCLGNSLQNVTGRYVFGRHRRLAAKTGQPVTFYRQETDLRRKKKPRTRRGKKY